MTTWQQRKKLYIYDLLGGKCSICGEKDIPVLQIDHVNSDGAKERREIGSSRSKLYFRVEKNPRRYQLLCANCNWRKRSTDLRVQRRSVGMKVALFFMRRLLVAFVMIGTLAVLVALKKFV